MSVLIPDWPSATRCLALLTFLFLGIAIGCGTPSTTYCESDTHCTRSEKCDLESNSCKVIETSDTAPAQADAGLQNYQIPDGWQGPTFHAEVEAAQAFGICDGEAQILGKGLVVTEDCTCSCGLVGGLGCGSAELVEWTHDENSCELNSCPVIGGSCRQNTQLIGPTDCVELSRTMDDTNFVRLQMAPVLAGSCALPRPEGSLQSDFESLHALCNASEHAEPTPSGFELKAEVPEAFNRRLCISAEGDLDCPTSGPFVERELLFEDIDDTRQCSASTCSCDVPSGACSGRLEIRGGDEFVCGAILTTLDCPSSPFDDGNLCTSLPPDAANLKYQLSSQTPPCSRLGEAHVSGSVALSSPTTLCCTADLD